MADRRILRLIRKWLKAGVSEDGQWSEILRWRSSLRAWCPDYTSEVEMIPLDGVDVISNLAPREIEAWIQSEDLHHLMAVDGAPLICLNSMLKRVRKKGPLSP